MFIVLEGVDGSGKSTQIAKLRQMLDKAGVANEYIHFPRFDAPFFGELIARFLRGELGSVEQVDPYIVAMLYAAFRTGVAHTDIGVGLQRLHLTLQLLLIHPAVVAVAVGHIPPTRGESRTAIVLPHSHIPLRRYEAYAVGIFRHILADYGQRVVLTAILSYD